LDIKAVDPKKRRASPGSQPASGMPEADLASAEPEGRLLQALIKIFLLYIQKSRSHSNVITESS
jgi:hypothetical protein